jgi:hypothetical protein
MAILHLGEILATSLFLREFVLAGTMSACRCDYFADLKPIIEQGRGPNPARTNRSDLVFCFALRAQMARNGPA